MTQRMVPDPIREYLVAYIGEQTGELTPTDVRFVWAHVGVGLLSYREGPRGAERVMTVVGDAAAAVHALEAGPQIDRQAMIDDLFGKSCP